MNTVEVLEVTSEQVRALQRLADESEGRTWDNRFWMEGVRKILGEHIRQTRYRLVVRRDAGRD